MVYSPGQVRNIFRYINFEPEWFLLGGPADGNEAQVFKEEYPRAQIIGIEPNREAFAYQEAMGFPGLLLPHALATAPGVGRFFPHTIRSGWVAAEGEEVRLVSLDQLSFEYGPFTDAVLWLDIEGQEMAALEGAGALLAAKAVRVMNLEIIEPRSDGKTEELDKFVGYLSARGYRLAGAWNVGPLGPGPSARFRRDVVFSAE